MRYLIYYLLPDIILYKFIENILTENILIFNEYASAEITLGAKTFKDFKKLTREDKLLYVDKYIESKPFLKKLDNNFLKLILFFITTVISIIGLFVK